MASNTNMTSNYNTFSHFGVRALKDLSAMLALLAESASAHTYGRL